MRRVFQPEHNLCGWQSTARVCFLCTSVPEKFLAVWKEAPACILMKWQWLWCCFLSKPQDLHLELSCNTSYRLSRAHGAEFPWCEGSALICCPWCPGMLELRKPSSLPPHMPVRNMTLVPGQCEFPFEPQPLPKANTALETTLYVFGFEN